MFINRDKVIQELLTLSRAQDVREGEFSLTIEGAFARTAISLSIQAPARSSLPMVGVPAQEIPPQEDSATPHIRTYQTTSYFLHECHRSLFAGNPDYERQFLISGASFPQEDRHMLDILIPVKLANASRVGVEADLRDLFTHLAELDDGHGLLLLGLCHSHLWKGRGAVNPSATDRALQDNLEESGYKTVQGIFSEDGFCGLFTNTIPFALTVLGTGYEEIETHDHQTVVRLTQAPYLSHQTLQTAQQARGQRLSSPNADPRV